MQVVITVARFFHSCLGVRCACVVSVDDVLEHTSIAKVWPIKAIQVHPENQT